MANTNLTIDMITQSGLMILHQKLRFLGGVVRDYDDSFAQTGAKIGDTLRVRLPNQYTVRSGRTIDIQDTTERKVDLPVTSQKGIDTEYTSEELALDIDEFEKRVLEPQMSVLASVVEADALQTMTKEVYQLVDDDGAAFDFHTVLQGKQKLDEALAPEDEQRTALLSPAHSTTLLDQLKGLFNDQQEISRQFKEGVMGHSVGFDFAQSTHAIDLTTGTAAKGDTSYNINGANQTGATITVDTGTTTFVVGDIVTLAGCNRVHPETKVDTGVLQQFVITAAAGAMATSLSISPSIVTSGGNQNVFASPTNAGAVSKIGAGNAETLNGTLVYHKEAFAFATADLRVPGGQVMASRKQFEGISLRVVQGYDITNDTFPMRWDILYGFKAIRPELACRLHADG